MTRRTRSKVREKIAQYWPDTDPQEIMDILDGYGVESYERGRVRVHLAILKVSEGRRDQLERLVRMAKSDFRDVVAFAEYPEEMRTNVIEMRQLSPQEAKALRQRDRKQYLDWLEG